MSTTSCLILALLGISGAFAQDPDFTDPVTLPGGANVVGLKTPNHDAFYGIPFAEPPIGDLRFAVIFLPPFNLHVRYLTTLLFFHRVPWPRSFQLVNLKPSTYPMCAFNPILPTSHSKGC